MLFNGGWWWFIPFRGTLTSVGCVLQRGFTIERLMCNFGVSFAALVAGLADPARPAPLGAVDILSYRQRPVHRAAYRNFGSYQSIVTNQSVEAAPAMAGIRWWEIRNPGANAVLYQDSTFAPGITDGIHRWMGSIAQDSNGNLGMGYSAGGPTLFPSVHYTGRLESDPLNEMTQGEGIFVTAGGGFTATTRRWGDYTSMNIDSTDDCTFWYASMYGRGATTGWATRIARLRVGRCGTVRAPVVARRPRVSGVGRKSMMRSSAPHSGRWRVCDISRLTWPFSSVRPAARLYCGSISTLR